ncbi:MAG: hypothetical protein COU08_03740 [Candidatus Harrisonbacteria bacterium CG10_big_fil_rev_8_21_14_0_10_42_17]|uniref:Prepilin-type N-terminal cleavage/methylation domain-containing protein n=1 Tax=Candidatus Harrisonbacteria bacterium CG10_big_fil_rev_8_21_14_0_10_42_17 TaxID=1974584 RepID=A0A2M6WH93_9BACT|nr:MAG: hypothetical protein COU08_03740 [Candidatus Harrisonbacteria bacterium CG10_big_fil_rev_8_21_14_0_10_42_17]
MKKEIRKNLIKKNKKHNSLFLIPHSSKSEGFTLIEVLIYVAIIGSVVSSFLLFNLSILNSGSKSYATQEVNGNLRIALDIVGERIRAAEGVTVSNSVFDTNPGTLSLVMSDGAKNPTVFDVSGGILRITEGVDDPINITTDEVNLTNVVFTNLTASSSRENIRIEITGGLRNAADANTSYTNSIQTTVSVRQ